MGGYCFLNNATIAAEFLTRGRRQRVAIVDVDVHHGNGTQRIFYDRGDVLFVSITAIRNGNTRTFWATPTSAVTAQAQARRSTSLWKKASTTPATSPSRRALDAVRRFTPDALVVSAGFDTVRRRSAGPVQTDHRRLPRNGTSLRRAGAADRPRAGRRLRRACIGRKRGKFIAGLCRNTGVKHTTRR
ncbi:MAG: hypothetical protein R2856_00225 [Caldilineaceae bacterium]